jgi:circadian clock protein KaiB
MFAQSRRNSPRQQSLPRRAGLDVASHESASKRRLDTARVITVSDTGDAEMTGLVLRLYIAGPSAISRRAEQNVGKLRALLKRDCPVEVIDVMARPELAESAGILATPTLSFEHPERPRRIVGDLSDTNRILHFLGLEPKESDA